MQLVIPFLADVVGEVGDRPLEHLYMRGHVKSDIRMASPNDLVPAVGWETEPDFRGIREERMTYWDGEGHWAVVSSNPTNIVIGARIEDVSSQKGNHPVKPRPELLEHLGCFATLHPDAPAKHAQRKSVSAEQRIVNIQYDNTAESSERAVSWSHENILAVEDKVLIRVPEPHYVVGRNARAGAYTPPVISIAVPTGFASQRQFHLEHLVSAADPDTALAIFNAIEAEGYYHARATEASTHPCLQVLLKEAVNYPWHRTSARAGLDILVEKMRGSLQKMNTADLRTWIELARARDRGFDSDEEAEAAFLTSKTLTPHLGRHQFLSSEFSRAFFASVYGSPGATPTQGTPRP